MTFFMKNSLRNFYAFTFPHQDFLLLLKSYLLIIGIPGFFFRFFKLPANYRNSRKEIFFSTNRYLIFSACHDMSTICPRYVHNIRLRYIVHRIGQIYILIIIFHHNDIFFNIPGLHPKKCT